MNGGLFACTAPPKPPKGSVFFEEIRKWCETDRMAILLGDFNCVYSARDKSRPSPFRDASTAVLSDIVADFALEDVGDGVGSNGPVRYTHFQGNSHACLDRVYLSLYLLPQCEEYRVIPVSFSDHCFVSLTLGRGAKRRNAVCWGLWKLNNKLVEDGTFVEAVNTCARKIFGSD